MALYLAIDAGGTKTDYVLADEARELARARNGTIKRLRANAEVTGANFAAGLQELTRISGRSMRAVERTCIGAAGATVPLVADWLREAHAAHVGGELLLAGDVDIALDAAFRGGPGVLVLAGTGSNVAGRLATGEITTAGGWGPALSDQGSGYRIGQKGLRAAFLALDERRPTHLIEALLLHWQLTSIDELVEFANSTPAPDFSQLSGLVVRCADAGDAVAQAVLRSEGASLGYLARLVLRRVAAGAAVGQQRLAFAGSIMKNCPRVREALVADVRAEFKDVQTLDGVVDPIDGALWRARGQSLQERGT